MGEQEQPDAATNPTPTTAEGKAWLDAVRADSADGSLWAVPSIREQLSEAYERVGLSDNPLPESRPPLSPEAQAWWGDLERRIIAGWRPAPVREQLAEERRELGMDTPPTPPSPG